MRLCGTIITLKLDASASMSSDDLAQEVTGRNGALVQIDNISIR